MAAGVIIKTEGTQTARRSRYAFFWRAGQAGRQHREKQQEVTQPEAAR